MDGIIYKSLRITGSCSTKQEEICHGPYPQESNGNGEMQTKRQGSFLFTIFFWPRMNAEIEQKVKNCQVCAAVQNTQPQEPLNYTKLPRFPFSRLQQHSIGKHLKVSPAQLLLGRRPKNCMHGETV
ncbi:integrase core domain [Elysia marginata]|uniref:Integrase core domain n=1 Tax=Elysia marginata TaxID=1093978 RepID=A0AAV4HAI6_9GAST|nr:integrase core domain [Elysia marginata]